MKLAANKFSVLNVLVAALFVVDHHFCRSCSHANYSQGLFVQFRIKCLEFSIVEYFLYQDFRMAQQFTQHTGDATYRIDNVRGGVR